MGTRLISRGLDLSRDDPSFWNLSHPETVRDIHAKDVAAGSEAVLTNTFGANRVWLTRYGQVQEMETINRTAVALAREAAGPARFVLGSIGPTAVDSPGTYREQAEYLLDAGADAILLETHQSHQAIQALHELRGAVPAPILVSLYIWPTLLEDSIKTLEDLGVDALGSNCEPGMALAVGTAKTLRAITQLPLIIKPSRVPASGSVEGELADFAQALSLLCELGPIMVGGCCGTDESYIAALRHEWYVSSRPDGTALSGAEPKSMNDRPIR